LKNEVVELRAELDTLKQKAAPLHRLNIVPGRSSGAA
jgi:hypothetical protein